MPVTFASSTISLCPVGGSMPLVNRSTKTISTTSTVSRDLRSRFVEGLSPSDREAILNAATPRRFHAKSVVVHQGRLGNHFFLLTIGRARHFFITETGQKILLNWLVPGDIFGAYAGLVTPVPSLFSAETVKDCVALAWDRATFRGLAARYPRLLDNGLLIATSYLTWFLAAHEALACYPARQRLAQVLVSLAKGIGQKGSDGFELDVTNEELAYSANVTLFTVSRFLSQWQRQGVVRKGRGKILLRSPERLFVHAA
jgi:CRP/FNR family transcriptional regulator, nitrogen oxide reductase regulator